MKNIMNSSFVVSLMLILSGNSLADPNDSGDNELRQLIVSPRKFEIQSHRDAIQLVVTGIGNDGAAIDLTRKANYETPTLGVVTVAKTGLVSPMEDGMTTIDVKYGDLQTSVEARVHRFEKPVSFSRQTLPMLAKSGCSGGACHGSPHGKAGFRLSLFGLNEKLDQVSLIRDELGRRTNPIEPEKSLLLLKPLMKVSHRGGKRLTEGTFPYELVRDWVAEGCRVESNEPECMSIEVIPNEPRILTFPNKTQQFRVVASFADGSQRDVTRLAKFNTSDPNVAVVSADGFVQGVDRGDIAVIVRYLRHIKTPLITFVRPIQGFAWKSVEPAKYVDEHVYAKLRQMQYLPSKQSDDSVFLRRVYLDVVGRLPTPEAVTLFLKDNSDSKRADLVDRLLDDPDHARFWAQKWGDLLHVSKRLLGAKSVYKMHRWIESAIARNMPYDDFVRSILSASGSTLINPAGNYFRTSGDTNAVTETTAQVFLGTRIQCAKCHNHPFERWTQNDYYGLSACFHRIQRSKTENGDERFIWNAQDGQVTHPQTGKAVPPWVPIKGELPISSDQTRREAFVDWLISKDNPIFAKVEVNRIWAHLFGRGIVEPFDDFRDSNPAANVDLLSALAKDLVRNRFDRKHILRVILNSNTYQTSASSDEANRNDHKYFSHYVPRMLTAEQLIDAIGQLTGRPEQFVGVPVETKATWLPAPDLKNHDQKKIGDIEFLKVFGQPERQTVCECERGDDASLGQALQLINGQTVHRMLTDKQNRFHQGLKMKQPVTNIISDLYVRSLARQPTPAELKIARSYIDSHADVAQALEDICWALINKNEFLFQH